MNALRNIHANPIISNRMEIHCLQFHVYVLLLARDKILSPCCIHLSYKIYSTDILQIRFH